jgi:phage-related protein
LSWTVETLNETVDAEVEALPEDMLARLARIALLIEEKGLERVGGPHVKHIGGRLGEMRMKGKSGISRALYVTAQGQRIVILRIFVKKTEKTPRHEIDLALSRVKLHQTGGEEIADGTHYRPSQEMDEGAKVPQGVRST